MDPQTLSLLLTSICFGLAAWALIKCNEHDRAIAKLETMVDSDRVENNRRFEEIKDTMHSIRDMLQTFILNNNNKSKDDND
jgi:hypothetical protein